MPYYGSSSYVGAGAAFAFDGTTTDMKVMEKLAANTTAIVCTSFQRANGTSWKVFGCAELWRGETTSIGGRVGLSNSTITFMARPPAIPVFDGSLLQTEYSLSTEMTRFNVEAFAKVCIPGTHVWSAVAMTADATISVSSSLRETILSPSGYVFAGTTLRERSLSDAGVAGVRRFTVNPSISVGADIAWSRGVYLSPALCVGIPIMSTARWADWNTVSVGLQCSLLFSLGESGSSLSR